MLYLDYPSIHPLYILILSGVMGGWSLYNLTQGENQGYTLEVSPVCHRADKITLTLEPMANFTVSNSPTCGFDLWKFIQAWGEHAKPTEKGLLDVSHQPLPVFRLSYTNITCHCVIVITILL